MEFVINYEVLDAYFAKGPLMFFWILLKAGGWVLLIPLFLYVMWRTWVMSRQRKFVSKWSYVVLALDVPKNNEQSPKAVESIFVALSGALSGGDFIDKYWHGKVQESFSFEIGNTEGYTQFYIRTPTHFRDLIEAAVFAQYPDAEIREVPDYTEHGPERFPSEEFDMWGADIMLVRSSTFPIKTYHFFEDTLVGELKDSMASFLENLSRFGNGEYFWFQVVMVPTSTDWKDKAEKEIKKLIGKKDKPKKTLLEKAFDIPHWLGVVGYIFFGGEEMGDGQAAKESQPSLVPFLSPGERTVVEAMQMKISKIGFLTKLRIVYLAKKEVYNGAKGVSPFFGAIQQFSSLDLNGFKPHVRFKTVKRRLFQKRRLASIQTRVLRAYKRRDPLGGGDPYILNTEELASVYHFPLLTVKAPALRKTYAKRSESPFALPREEGFSTFRDAQTVGTRERKEKETASPRLPDIGEPSIFVRREDARERQGEGSPPADLPI